MRYVGRCGVRASARNRARHAGLARRLFAMWTPDALVSALVEAHNKGHLGELKSHFFSFDGLLQTARWATGVAQGRVRLEAGQGFRGRSRWLAAVTVLTDDRLFQRK